MQHKGLKTEVSRSSDCLASGRENARSVDMDEVSYKLLLAVILWVMKMCSRFVGGYRRFGGT